MYIMCVFIYIYIYIYWNDFRLYIEAWAHFSDCLICAPKLPTTPTLGKNPRTSADSSV